jgi:hypothetical protein
VGQPWAQRAFRRLPAQFLEPPRLCRVLPHAANVSDRAGSTVIAFAEIRANTAQCSRSYLHSSAFICGFSTGRRFPFRNRQQAFNMPV